MKFNPETSEHLFFERLGSTNDHLQELNKSKNLSEGTVVWTNFQTHGRGHSNNVWESETDCAAVGPVERAFNRER